MEKFRIDSCIKWIEENKFNRIAIQLPDEDLHKVQDLIEILTASINDIELFVVGDGCSPCCNDLINAQYCQAQCLIHFGHSCLVSSIDDSQQTIPIFYVFYQQSLPEDAFAFLSEDNHTDKPYCLIFYDPCFRDSIEQFSLVSNRIIFSKIGLENSTDPLYFSLYGRSVHLPVQLDPSNYSIVFISNSKYSSNNFALYFYAYEFHSFPTAKISSSKLLSKRMYGIECARNGSSYGLLLSSNSLLNLPTTIHTLLDRTKKLLDKNNRDYYTFLMNTLSITKMNNFEKNIDIYILCSSCPECQWLSPEQKQFNIPLVSLADVVQAFESDEQNLSLNYSFDLTQILSKLNKFVDENQTQDDNDKTAVVLKHPNALLLQQDGANRINSSSRTWWGLQISDSISNEQEEKHSVAELKEGKFGIAAGYSNEKFS